MKNISDFKLAFGFGMTTYVLSNIGVNTHADVEWYIWFTANILSGISNIALAFVNVKLFKMIYRKFIKE